MCVCRSVIDIAKLLPLLLLLCWCLLVSFFFFFLLPLKSTLFFLGLPIISCTHSVCGSYVFVWHLMHLSKCIWFFFFKFNSMDFKCIFQNNSYRFLTDKSNRISVASLFNAQRWKKKKKSGMFKHQAAHIFETVLAPNFIIILPSNTIQFTTNCKFYLRNICWY